MDYVLLIAVDPSVYADLPPEQAQGIYAEYDAYTAELRARGVYVDGNPLQSVDTATTVQVRDGVRSTTDGPYAEAKEVLLGYYVIRVDSLDEALEWAAKIPDARYGSIEVRPVMELPGS
ncbi:MAG TPA: YciI family protein [Actinomycetes bacterium]|nr:YciI family protein [Actinomycetes bacterium]